jgi:phosphate starvation-inducible PhoH-like protein
MVITGDITQVDLPRSRQSGLREAMRILHKVAQIKLFQFEGLDVVRHPLVQEIINAYAQHTPE